MLAAIASGETGLLLAPLVVLYAGLAAVFRGRERAEWPVLGGAALSLMAASTALLVRFGYGNAGVSLGAGWVYLLYAGGLLAWATRSERRLPAWLGLGMLLLATWQLVVFRFGPSLAFARAWFDCAVDLRDDRHCAGACRAHCPRCPANQSAVERRDPCGIAGECGGRGRCDLADAAADCVAAPGGCCGWPCCGE